ncbi:WapI family immunity protein [Nocardia grenadensis]|uniref:WapI family immunity protein n=1 Tax=Nocardia grenadensis TaxID=931537 RepID=UPI003D706993
MRLIDSDGYGVELSVAGYQFPDHIDPRIRYSWLVIAGTANCPDGNWSFRWQALSLDDTVELADWLGRIAAEAEPAGASTDGPARLAFTEPDLSFTATRTGSAIELRIGLDLEFSPPWDRRATAGSPYIVTARLAAADIATAAKDLGAEVDSYLPPGGSLLGRAR